MGAIIADEDAQRRLNAYIAERASRGLRSLAIIKSTVGGAAWTLVGLISLLDPPRTDSAETIKRALELGVQVHAEPLGASDSQLQMKQVWCDGSCLLLSDR